MKIYTEAEGAAPGPMPNIEGGDLIPRPLRKTTVTIPEETGFYWNYISTGEVFQNGGWIWCQNCFLVTPTTGYEDPYSYLRPIPIAFSDHTVTY